MKMLMWGTEDVMRQTMTNAPAGPWVLASDYEALAAKLETSESLLKSAHRHWKAAEARSDGYYSEEYLAMFLGFVCADLPELHTLECPKMLESWKRFKKVMGETTQASDNCEQP